MQTRELALERRLAALQRYDVMDTAAETAFDDLTALAAQICGTPISLVSLLDDRRQWFKSSHGLAVRETPLDVAFCRHAIEQVGVMLVPDTAADERFRQNPLVLGAPGIRFYAGAPLLTPDGTALGTLCVLDSEPRELSSEKSDLLHGLAKQAVHLLEARLVARRLAESLRQIEQLRAFLPVCAYCSNIRDESGAWHDLASYFSARTELRFSHGACPTCAEKVMAEIDALTPQTAGR